MSRSLWALTRHYALAGADRPGRSERGSCSLAFVASSAKQYLLTVLIMAGLVGLVAVPTPALAANGSHADHAAEGASASVAPHGLVVLAFGSGYGSPTGSSPVRALQRRLARAGFVPGPFDGQVWSDDAGGGDAFSGRAWAGGRRDRGSDHAWGAWGPWSGAVSRLWLHRRTVWPGFAAFSAVCAVRGSRPGRSMVATGH